MNEMARSLKDRVVEATTSLNSATQEGDDYLAEVRVGELEELLRLADEHEIEVPGLSATVEAHTGTIPVVRPDAG